MSAHWSSASKTCPGIVTPSIASTTAFEPRRMQFLPMRLQAGSLRVDGMG